MFYSHTTGGFYSTAIHGDNIPADAVEISEAEHAVLLEGQSQGKIISADANGRPTLTDKPLPSLDEVKASAIAVINNTYNQKIIALAGNAPQAERETWALQLEAAKAFQANTAADEHIKLLNSIRRPDETIEELAAKIIGKAQLMKQMIGVALGIKRRAEKAVEEAQDNASVQSALDAAKAEMNKALAMMRNKQ